MEPLSSGNTVSFVVIGDLTDLLLPLACLLVAGMLALALVAARKNKE